ncbi:MAG: YidC/Oxa1 family membrane protein insertase [Clostridia bacterium]|nr:YidC/Oxa1 family membrane protein insertase [Clostridia bacterium]
MFDIINKPLGFIMKLLAELFGGNFAASVFVFTLIINLIMLPLSIKSQKSSVSQMRIKPKLDELKKRYGDDRRKMAQEQQKLYQEEGVSMSGGCLPMIVRMVLLFSIYYLILSPLTYMAGAKKDDVKTVTTAINSYVEKHEDAKSELANWDIKKTRNQELYLVAVIRDDPGKLEKVIGSKQYSEIKEPYENIVEKYEESNISFNLFGIDLIQTPKFSVDFFSGWQAIWLLPISAFLAQMLTSIVSMRINKRINPDAPTMAGLMLTMPIISLIIGFSFPGGVCFYWICSSLIGGAIQSGVQLLYGPHKLLARERVKELSKVCDFEAGQLKKLETEEE